MNNAKILVTGGAGFIGSHIVERLLHLGHRVVVVDNLSTGMLNNLGCVLDDIEFHREDIRDTKIHQLLKGIDFVIHEAAMNRVQCSIDNPDLANQVNVNGTLNILITARDNNVRKVIYASSSSVYGDTAVSPKTESLPTRPKSPYAVGKLAAENYCTSFATVYGLPTVCLRYFSVYGKRQRSDIQYAAVVPKFIDLTRNHRPLPIYGDGTQTRDFTYVEDIVQATILGMSETASGVYNVSGGSGSSVNDLADNISRILGIKSERLFKPLPKGDAHDSHADITKIRQLGYSPKYDLMAGLEAVLH